MSAGMKVINVPKQLTIQHIHSAHKRILEDSNGAQSLLIHIGAIEEIDTSGVQLLYSLYRWAESKKIKADFSGDVTEALEIALLSGGFCREVPRHGNDLTAALIGLCRGNNAG